ncbi:MAG: hypothetical protein EA407_12985 [Rhodobacteraceae bacterium]|nr:MAG: hypothetical protein EA407_12985 [Paracoccaceae bacterium]
MKEKDHHIMTHQNTVYADGEIKTASDDFRLYHRPKRNPKKPSRSYQVRARFSHALKKQALKTLPSVPLIAAEEAIAEARANGKPVVRAAWKALQIRREHMAIVEILQAAHLQNVGDEISRSEVVAALMLHGLDAVRQRPEFQNPSFNF